MFMPESTLAMAAVNTEFWVCCDNCQKWRLLPVGRTDANLPKEWLCGMLDWLPEKITCDSSEEETTEAMKALSASQFQSHANGSISGVTSYEIQYLSQNAHSFSNHSPDNKLSSKDGLGSGKGNFLSLNKNNTKTSLQESSKSRSLSNIIPPPTESYSWKKAESADPAKSLILISKRKERTLTKGDDKLLLKVRGKRESNEDGAETSKRVKIDENTSSLSAQRKVKISSKYQGAEVDLPKDQKIGGMDRLVISLKNLGGRAPVQAPADYASSDMNKSNKGSSSKKRKLKDSQEILPDGSAEHLSTKKKKFRALDITSNEISNKNGDDRTNEEVSTLRDSSPGFVIAQTDVLDGMSTGMDRRSKHQKMLCTQQSLDRVELMKGDTGHGRILLAATSSSSKVSSSHKTRAKYEVKGSPVESISSSPLRVKLTDAGSRLPRHGDTKTGFASVMGNARNISAKKINFVSKLSRVATKEKLSSDFRQESLKCDPAHRNAEPLAESANSHSFIGTAGFLGNGELSADTCVDHSAGESRAHMNNRASTLLHIQSDDVSKQRPKDRDECPKPDFGILGEKVLETAMEERFESELRIEHAPSHTYTRTFTNVADKNDKKCGGRRESLGHSLNDGRVNKLAKEYHYLQDYSLNKLSHESKGQTRAASVSGDSRIKKSILALNPQDGAKEGISNWASARAVSQVSACRVNLVDVSANGNVSKEVIMNKNGASNCLDCFELDQHEYKDVIASSPARVNLSNQTANDVLKKATDLRDQADWLKNSGFTSESSGKCFQAALMFLLGASLLENCSGENGKQTPLQVYGVTAKLLQSCATEFEGHKEMAAAALAYKFMEVAFMKVVYWEHASWSRDLHEVQAALLQGESPSSSASDVDNLNNQTVADRPSLPKGATPQVVGSNIIVGRNRPCFARLLDFTQDVSLTMEASKKCRICFTAAIAGTEKSKISNPMASLKTVIDFNFQDIERLIPLAWEAIDRLGLSGAKE